MATLRDALLIGVATLVGLWLVAVLALYVLGRRQGGSARLGEALRLVPDVFRLLRRLTADPSLARGVRWAAAVLVVYLALPFDLVPDFIPVVGYADDVILILLVLRHVVRRSGGETIDRHWSGTPDGLRIVRRLAGVR